MMDSANSSQVLQSSQVLGDSQVRSKEAERKRSTGEHTSMAQSSRHERQDKSPDMLKLPAWVIGILIGILVTFAGNLASTMYWKGQVDTKVENLESRTKEDRENIKTSLDYIRTQGEVNGKELARIRAWQDQQEKKGNR